ncbi:TetR/AcrR family transcriptional regulator [Pseudohalioglobus sediminis]|uniref:TetR/AcrR family transcriptional regulator n=1 Tax=Pseudohalioglobus sediminis TaxID=2606449 RepID=A0A5B0X1M2_9GAMM|nr:TetR/AcrR family transcriptional regulator [Pseudohalioglobus sediminis]KAA1193220.1 TetR/AcrR family transcriptional regulator [Pseudohalioglobus sediminis]
MARPAEFDRTQALEAAMKLFWARGYTATSLPDLLAAMGIARSSFYASFKTKRGLFVECLELFGDRTLDIVDRDAGKIPAAALPRAFFEATLLHVSRRKAKRGCMMVNTVLELADVDHELNQLATLKLEAIENAFALAFERAQQEGQLDTRRSAQELASIVMTINFGLRVQSRQMRSPEQIRTIIDNSLSMLGLAA